MKRVNSDESSFDNIESETDTLKKSKLTTDCGDKIPTYIMENDFRRVKPYWFDYCTWAKGRWFNRTLSDVFQKEFRDRPAAYYAAACTAGLIKVNDSAVEFGYKIKQGDRVQHRIHRHEPPVLLDPAPEIIAIDDGFIVVSKPPSVPMHPSGRYRYNTLTSILLHHQPDLFSSGHISCVNRLDRLVSGIVILSTSPQKADELRQAMQEQQFRKFYLAQVAGKFPVEEEEVSPIFKELTYVNSHKIDNTLVFDCVAPLLVVEHKLGLSCVADLEKYPAAKSSQTRFTRLAYNADTDCSLVLCEPVTGRTHQIRLHLQYLGFPIINDPLYNNKFWQTLHESHENDPSRYANENWIVKVKEMAEVMSRSSTLFNQESDDHCDEFINGSCDICPDCSNPRADPSLDSLRIDLHAYKYSGPIGTFATALPNWSYNDLLEDGIISKAEGAFNVLDERKRDKTNK